MSDSDDKSSKCSTEELDEPKLSFERILNILPKIFETDSITSACLHSKLFVIGTQLGRIHVLDHLGNKINLKELFAHIKPVTCISIDEKGEYLISCSDDKFVVYGLLNDEHNYVYSPEKPNLNVVAIDPFFHKAGRKRRFVVGDDRVVLWEKQFLGGHKQTFLQSKEQKVRTLSWHGQFIAWATDVAVQIYDVEQRVLITRIKRESKLDQCQLCWRDEKTLLVGWSNTIKVCSIKERSLGPNKLPRKYVEIISMFETDFSICGLATLNSNIVTLSIHNPGETTQFSDTSTLDSSLLSDKSSTSSASTLMKPQVHILEIISSSYNEISRDILSPSGCLSSNLDSIIKNNPYKLLSSHRDGLYLIVCPKDVISAKPRDHDDHLDWLIQHKMFKECCLFARDYTSELKRHNTKDLVHLYMQDLSNEGKSENYQEAAEICSSICDTDQRLWEDTIQKFHDLQQLGLLLPHLPKGEDSFHLKKETYNFMLNQFLKDDQFNLLKAIKTLPSKLYSLEELTEQVVQKLSLTPENLVLMAALAELYTKMGKFEEAVNIYLDDKSDKERIFSLIRENKLIPILRSKMDKLMDIDPTETSKLLVENLDSISTNYVIPKLEEVKDKRYLLNYLHVLVQKDPELCTEYHDKMVKLYASYQKDSLLDFLKLSTGYRLDIALEVCEEFNLNKEVIFLCQRTGDFRKALRYIIESPGDCGSKVRDAINFCEEHQDNPGLLDDLIQYSMSRTEFICPLLESIGSRIDDPFKLINRIPKGLEIEGITLSMQKFMIDFGSQISRAREARDQKAKKAARLLEQKGKLQSRGIELGPERLCEACRKPIYDTKPGEDREFTVFLCHHVFHKECCDDSDYIDPDQSIRLRKCKVCKKK